MSANDLNHTLEVGSVLSASWGYEQTNVSYYQVVGLAGKTQVKIKAINSQITEQSGMSGECIPVIDSFKDDTVLRRKVGHGDVVAIEDFIRAYKWNGRANSFSSYA